MVSDEMVKAAHAAHAQSMWAGGTSDDRMRAAIEAVAPAIRAAAMEEAAKYHDSEIARLEQQIEHNAEYARRSGSKDTGASDFCRDQIGMHRTSAAAIRAAKEVK